MNILWLQKAKRGLEAELERIAAEDEHTAQKVASTIKARVEQLGKFPESGKPGRIEGTREFVFPSLPYLLPYRVRNDTVEILRFFHTSQNPPSSW